MSNIKRFEPKQERIRSGLEEYSKYLDSAGLSGAEREAALITAMVSAIGYLDESIAVLDRAMDEMRESR